MARHDWPELAEDARRRWDENASFWDEHMGEENNAFHNLLIRPATEGLLQIQSGERVLDIACGNGNFSRRLADLGASVVALDSSGVMIEKAKARTPTLYHQIRYEVVDAGDSDQMSALGVESFDAVVSNMGVMDMPVVSPFFESMAGLLKPGGRCVFSVTHPCFQGPNRLKVAEEQNRDGRITSQYGVKITKYITPPLRNSNTSPWRVMPGSFSRFANNASVNSRRFL